MAWPADVNEKKRNTALALNIVPFAGILGFILLYLYASTLYPGGSQADPIALGFDWVDNYWCDLTNATAINGEANPSRPYAILASALLCLSLAIFFIQFSERFPEDVFGKRAIGIGGVLSMATALMVFTRYHDRMIIISSIFGLFALIGITREVYRSALTRFRVTGMLCLSLLVANNAIFYTRQFIEWLPLIQKITFLLVLAWIAGLNVEMNRRIRALHKAAQTFKPDTSCA